jgi:hypothetical protein
VVLWCFYSSSSKYFLETSVCKPNLTFCYLFLNFEGITSFTAFRKTFFYLHLIKMNFLVSNTSPSYLTFTESIILSFHFSLLSQVSFAAFSVKRTKINYSVAKNKETHRCVLSTCDVMDFLLLISRCQRWLPLDLHVFFYITSIRWIIN